MPVIGGAGMLRGGGGVGLLVDLQQEYDESPSCKLSLVFPFCFLSFVWICVRVYFLKSPVIER